VDVNPCDSVGHRSLLAGAESVLTVALFRVAGYRCPQPVGTTTPNDSLKHAHS
jgi:hypothetical protein